AAIALAPLTSSRAPTVYTSATVIHPGDANARTATAAAATARTRNVHHRLVTFSTTWSSMASCFRPVRACGSRKPLRRGVSARRGRVPRRRSPQRASRLLFLARARPRAADAAELRAALADARSALPPRAQGVLSVRAVAAAASGRRSARHAPARLQRADRAPSRDRRVQRGGRSHVFAAGATGGSKRRRRPAPRVGVQPRQRPRLEPRRFETA